MKSSMKDLTAWRDLCLGHMVCVVRVPSRCLAGDVRVAQITEAAMRCPRVKIYLQKWGK